ncbi:hypothetical protein TWF281_007302 [Arthrobotrys megalospora]
MEDGGWRMEDGGCLGESWAGRELELSRKQGWLKTTTGHRTINCIAIKFKPHDFAGIGIVMEKKGAGQEARQSLTESEKAVLVEYQKILITLNSINTSLERTIATTREKGPVQASLEDLHRVARDTFSGPPS